MPVTGLDALCHPATGSFSTPLLSPSDEEGHKGMNDIITRVCVQVHIHTMLLC